MVKSRRDILQRITFPLIVALTLLPVIYVVHKIWVGDIAFWYDPVRDMLSAWSNFNKPTLIGPPSGIPGVFYGPYWIWLLGIGMLFSKDPRIVTFIVLAIPYLVLFPLILYAFRAFGIRTIVMLFALFLLSFNNYADFLWNPHLAPLLLLSFIMLFLLMWQEEGLRGKFFAVAAGFFLGLLVNFHISFGIGATCGIGFYFLYLLINTLVKGRERMKAFLAWSIKICLFSIGYLVAFGPFLLFEIRHQFQQSRVLFTTLTQYGGTIALHGLTKTEIIFSFFGRAGQLLQLPTLIAALLLVATGLYVIYLIRNKSMKLSAADKRLLGILASLALGVLFVYLTARNPVWSYHFIAVEVLFLLLVGVLMERVNVFRIFILLWTLVLLLQFAMSFPGHIATDPKKIPGDLASEEGIVRQIAADSGKGTYTVYAYSPSIYMYEYSYLFKWMEKKDFSYDPGKVQREGTVYLILPPHVKQALYDNFIHYRTPPHDYKTTGIWTMPDGSTIIKRENK